MTPASRALALYRAGDRAEAILAMEAGASDQPEVLAPLKLMLAGYDDYAIAVLEVVAG